MSYKATVVGHSAKDEKVILQRVDATGAVISSSPSVSIALPDADAILAAIGSSVPIEIKLREIGFCDNSTGTPVQKYMIVLASALYTKS